MKIRRIMSTEKVFQIVFSILLAVNVVGNVLVILVILKNQSMKTSLNFLLVNLAVSDLLVAVFFAPRFLWIPTFTHPTGTLGKAICVTLTGMNISWVASLVSGFALVWIALTRCNIHFTSYSLAAFFIFGCSRLVFGMQTRYRGNCGSSAVAKLGSTEN